MAATSDDDAATSEDSDGDTTAAAVAKRVPKLGGDDEEDDRTVQQKVDPKVREAQLLRNANARAARSAGSSPVPSVSPSPSPPATQAPVRMTSKKPTAVGLGAPPVAGRPAAGFDPSPSTAAAQSPPTAAEKTTRKSATTPRRPPLVSQADETDDSVTATSPVAMIPDSERPSGAPLPITMPGDVKITEIVDGTDEPLDETEVRTLIARPSATPTKRAAAPIPAAGVPAVPVPKPASKPAASSAPSASAQVNTEADEPDDSVTTQAPSPLGIFHDEDDLKTSPPRLAPLPMPAAGRRPSEARMAVPALAPDDDDYAEESVTTRGPAVAYEDDSVTAQAPVAHGVPRRAALGMPPTLEDRNAGGRVVVPAGGRQRVGSSPDIGSPRAAGSITAEAPPGHHLSNMPNLLHAIPSSDTENHTAVMVNAPVKPPSARGPGRMMTPHGGRQGAAIADLRADLREPASDSGLRVARAELPSGDHANLDVLLGPAANKEASSGSRPALEPPHGHVHGRGPNPFAKTEKAFHSGAGPSGAQPSLHEFDFATAVKKPRYGLLVAAVAVLSFAIPLVLFILLHSGASDAPPREKSELQADRVARGDALRVKAGSAAAKASASASSSGRRNDPPPRRRW